MSLNLSNINNSMSTAKNVLNNVNSGNMTPVVSNNSKTVGNIIKLTQNLFNKTGLNNNVNKITASDLTSLLQASNGSANDYLNSMYDSVALAKSKAIDNFISSIYGDGTSFNYNALVPYLSGLGTNTSSATNTTTDTSSTNLLNSLINSITPQSTTTTPSQTSNNTTLQDYLGQLVKNTLGETDEATALGKIVETAKTNPTQAINDYLSFLVNNSSGSASNSSSGSYGGYSRNYSSYYPYSYSKSKSGGGTKTSTSTGTEYTDYELTDPTNYIPYKIALLSNNIKENSDSVDSDVLSVWRNQQDTLDGWLTDYQNGKISKQTLRNYVEDFKYGDEHSDEEYAAYKKAKEEKAKKAVSHPTLGRQNNVVDSNPSSLAGAVKTTQSSHPRLTIKEDLLSKSNNSSNSTSKKSSNSTSKKSSNKSSKNTSNSKSVVNQNTKKTVQNVAKTVKKTASAVKQKSKETVKDNKKNKKSAGVMF